MAIINATSHCHAARKAIATTVAQAKRQPTIRRSLRSILSFIFISIWNPGYQRSRLAECVSHSGKGLESTGGLRFVGDGFAQGVKQRMGVGYLPRGQKSSVFRSDFSRRTALDSPYHHNPQHQVGTQGQVFCFHDLGFEAATSCSQSRCSTRLPPFHGGSPGLSSSGTANGCWGFMGDVAES